MLLPRLMGQGEQQKAKREILVDFHCGGYFQGRSVRETWQHLARTGDKPTWHPHASLVRFPSKAIPDRL